METAPLPATAQRVREKCLTVFPGALDVAEFTISNLRCDRPPTKLALHLKDIGEKAVCI